ncbi:hypothetical protein J3E69DRAFT_348866 [Trichoderma sp. SZMC 28015]
MLCRNTHKGYRHVTFDIMAQSYSYSLLRRVAYLIPRSEIGLGIPRNQAEMHRRQHMMASHG